MSDRSTWYQQEDEEQRQAFELYYGLGFRRSYAQVAHQVGVSLSTIKNWARAFRWQERIDQRGLPHITAHQAAGQQESDDQLNRYRQLIEAAQATTLKSMTVTSGKTTVRELIRLLAMRLDSEETALATALDSMTMATVVIYDPDK